MESDQQSDSVGPKFCGYLKKLKSSTISKLFGNTNLRWFEINFESELIGYKTTNTDMVYQETYEFDTITDFSEDILEKDKDKCKWNYGFQIFSTRKHLILFVETKEEHINWIYGMKLLLKRVPEAFELIPKNYFDAAMRFFVKPYYEQIRQAKEEKEKQVREERERIENERLEREREKMRRRVEAERKMKEEEERRRKEKEQKKLMEEAIKIEKYKDKFEIYDGDHKAIVRDAEVGLEEKEFEISEKGLSSRRSIDKHKKIAFRDEELEDWNYYDENNRKISNTELIRFNPVLDKQNEKFGLAFHSIIKGYIDPQKRKDNIHLEGLHIPVSLQETKKKRPAFESYEKLHPKDSKEIEPDSKKGFSPIKSLIAKATFDPEDEGPTAHIKKYAANKIVDQIAREHSQEIKKKKYSKQALLDELTLSRIEKDKRLSVKECSKNYSIEVDQINNQVNLKVNRSIPFDQSSEGKNSNRSLDLNSSRNI